MQKPLSVFLAILAACASAVAQDAPDGSRAARTAPNKAAAVPTATPGTYTAPAAEREQESRGIWKTLFGSRYKRPLGPARPAPAPNVATATPAPAPATPVLPQKIAKSAAGKKAAPTVATSRTKKPAPKAKPADATAEPAVAENTPPAVTPENPEPTAPTPVKKPRKGKSAPLVAAQEGVEPPPDADPETKEKFRFEQAKAKAAADPEVMEFKAKADSAVSDEDARSAQRAYNKALFGKMRKIDSGLDERIDSMEAAILKRLDGK